MNIRNYLKIAASGLTIIAAIYSLVKTKFARGFTGLEITGMHETTEIHTVWGDLFTTMGMTPLIKFRVGIVQLPNSQFMQFGL